MYTYGGCQSLFTAGPPSGDNASYCRALGPDLYPAVPLSRLRESCAALSTTHFNMLLLALTCCRLSLDMTSTSPQKTFPCFRSHSSLVQRVLKWNPGLASRCNPTVPNPAQAQLTRVHPNPTSPHTIRSHPIPPHPTPSHSTLFHPIPIACSYHPTPPQ